MGSVRARWLAFALTSMIGCSQGVGDVADERDASVEAALLDESSPASAEARAVVARLTSALESLRSDPPRIDPALAEPPPRLESTASAVRIVHEGAWLKVDVANAPKQVELRLPVDAQEAFLIADPQTGVAARVRLRGAQKAKAEVVAADVVYRKAAPGLGDLVHRPSASGTEDFVLYEQKPAEEKLVYEVALDERVRGLRLVANTLELLDEGGAPRLRVNPPYVIGNDGTRHEAALSVEGCAVDTNPAAPWDREPVAPGASSCTVEVAWNDRGVSYPAVVDPSWVSTKDMITGRYMHVAALLPTGKVLVAGGYTNTYSKDCELYDPGTNTWASTASMSADRIGHGGSALASGKVLVVGGFGLGGYLASGEVYDPQTGTWSSTANSLSVGREYPVAVLLEDGRVLVVSGYGTSSNYVKAAELYSPATNSFASTGSLNVGRYEAVGVRLADGRVLITGGSTASGYTTSAEIYDPVTGAFTQAASLDRARDRHTMTLLDSGKVLLYGGRTGSAANPPTTLLYDPAVDGWTTLSVPSSTQSHTATRLSDGKVLIAGGIEVTTTSKAAFLFDPATNAVTATEDLPSARAYHTATRLPSGDVLLVGGYLPTYSLKTTVRYQPDITCTSGAQCESGNCVGGRCCESACDGGCGRCDVAGSEGTCVALAAGSSGNPSCAPYVCNGTSTSCPTSCTYDSHCASGYFCAGGQCYSKLAQGAACTANNQCQSGNCVDGYCCNGACGGACDVCSVALGASANGVCTNLPSGTTCGNYVCNGSSGACPSSCSSDANCASGRYCSSGSCVAKRDLGQSCTSNNQCSSGNCVDGVCCNSTCAGGCNRCNLAGSVGTCTNVPAGQSGQNPSCGLYACSGTTSSCPTSCSNDGHCVGSAQCIGGVCVGKLGLGETCNQNTECDSGHCVDGVCCNTACAGGGCDRCDLVGYVGTCRTVTAGGQGSPSCAPYVCNGTSTSCPVSCASDAQCVTGYACIGGVCKTKQALGTTCGTGNDCASGHCVDGVCCDSACNGACERCDLGGSEGSCKALPDGSQAPACGAYLCNGVSGSCPTSCQGDEDCDGHCYAGQCYGKQPLGSVCSSDAACESGFCVDGTCCDSACDGQCARCDAPGAVGTCTAVKGNPVGKRPPCTNDGSVCGGSCDGVNLASCSYPSAGAACDVSRCEGDAFVEPVCDGQGRCEAKGESCAPYGCGESGCLTGCAGDGDCASGAACVDGVCVGPAGGGAGEGAALWEGDVDEGGCGCRVAGGREGSGGAMLAGVAMGVALWRRRRGAGAG